LIRLNERLPTGCDPLENLLFFKFRCVSSILQLGRKESPACCGIDVDRPLNAVSANLLQLFFPLTSQPIHLRLETGRLLRQLRQRHLDLIATILPVLE
jgi:hypothetical protein